MDMLTGMQQLLRGRYALQHFAPEFYECSHPVPSEHTEDVVSHLALAGVFLTVFPSSAGTWRLLSTDAHYWHNNS